MKRDNIVKVLNRLSKIHNDYSYLKSLDDADLLTTEMRNYKKNIETWILGTFSEINDITDMYMSSLPKPNEDGFISPINKEATSPKEFIRVISNFTSFDDRAGKYTINDPMFDSFKANKEDHVSSDNPNEDIFPKDHKELVNEATVGGMAAGYVILDQKENNVKTEVDYFDQPYSEEEQEGPIIDSNHSFTEDCIDDTLIDVIGDDISLF